MKTNETFITNVFNRLVPISDILELRLDVITSLFGSLFSDKLMF